MGSAQIPVAVRQDHRLFTVARDPDGLDEVLFTKVAAVAIARIGGPVVTVTEIASRYNPERPNSRKGPAL